MFFRGADFFKGSPIFREIIKIKNFFDLNFEEKTSSQLEKLNSILAHAKNTTDYYKNINLKYGIESLPLVNKNIIRDNFSSFLSNEFDDNSRIAQVTSGSTGTPFKLFHDKFKRVRNTADTITFAEYAGYKVGKKLYYLKIWSGLNYKSNFLKFIQNMVSIDVLNFKAEARIIAKAMMREKNHFNIIGYSSAVELLLEEFKTNDFKCTKIKSIITMSEAISDKAKVEGESYFGCKVLSRYSNIENGIIAQQTICIPNFFMVNSASYYVEIFDLEKDVLVDDGVLGRIVITDLYNKAMPFLRYDTGDIGALENIWVNNKCVRVFSKIEGRKLDQIFNSKGELISSFIVYKFMWKYTEIVQYQFVQKNLDLFTFILVVNGVFNRESELRSDFVGLLGDVKIEIEYQSEIPLLNSGKRKKVVNLMTSI
jgi:phenylacetate-CoA ligase